MIDLETQLKVDQGCDDGKPGMTLLSIKHGPLQHSKDLGAQKQSDRRYGRIYFFEGITNNSRRAQIGSIKLLALKIKHWNVFLLAPWQPQPKQNACIPWWKKRLGLSPAEFIANSQCWLLNVRGSADVKAAEAVLEMQEELMMVELTTYPGIFSVGVRTVCTVTQSPKHKILRRHSYPRREECLCVPPSIQVIFLTCGCLFLKTTLFQIYLL